MKKFLSVIRSQEWWGYKIPPLLALCYGTVLLSNTAINKVAWWFLFLLLLIIIEAIYVSIINDITDINEDAAAGKKNRMASFAPRVRWLFPAVCMCIIIYLCVVLNNKLSIALFFFAWLSFTLYSFPPVRLKKRGIFGVLADACGSTFFPGLLMASATSSFIGQNIDWAWFSAVGTWALANGLRGILWHQFYDRENDIKINLNTFASKVDPEKFKPIAIAIMIVEVIALAVMLYKLMNPIIIIFLAAYFFNVNDVSQNRLQHHDNNGSKKSLLSNISQRLLPGNFFPISLLVAATIAFPSAWIVLIIHIIFFNARIKLICKNIIIFFRQLIFKTA